VGADVGVATGVGGTSVGDGVGGPGVGIGVGGGVTSMVGPACVGLFPCATARNVTFHVPAGSVAVPTYVPFGESVGPVMGTVCPATSAQTAFGTTSGLLV
jgi:hypothetical protein